MSSNIHLKNQAISLRKNGESYNNIVKILNIKSKGTLNNWFKNIKLSKKSLKLLDKNSKLAHRRGLFAANKNRKIKIENENREALIEGQNQIHSISQKELVLIGATLYWGEGTKSEKNTVSLSFCNSDPLMIKVYMRFIREILKIPEEKIRAGIHLYPSTQESKARKFWSKTTQLPEDRFYLVRQVSRASENKRPFNKLPYGTLVLKINNRQQFYKVKGMIKGIIEKTKL